MELRDFINDERAKLKVRDLSSLVPSILGRLKLEERSGFQKLVRDWPAHVGSAAAVHSVPAEIRGQVLAIKVDHSVWKCELERNKGAILKKIQGEYPMVRSLMFIF